MPINGVARVGREASRGEEALGGGVSVSLVDKRVEHNVPEVSA